MSNLYGFGLPFIMDTPKSREESLEEARKSGLIKSEKDLRGPNAPEFCCKACGSKNLVVGMPTALDTDKGVELPYICKDCGYEGMANIRIRNFEGTKIIADIIPDGLVGVTGHFHHDTPGAYSYRPKEFVKHVY